MSGILGFADEDDDDEDDACTFKPESRHGRGGGMGGRRTRTAGSQTTRRQAAQTRFEVAQAEVDAHKLAIRELAGRRDAVERECRDLTEHVEAAKAELHRWQREYEQLQRQVATSVGINYTSEQQKTLRANLKQVNDSKRQLELQLGELEAEVTQRGQTLASHRHLAQELAKKRSILITEMKALLATLLERRRTLREKRKSTVAISAATVASTNSITRLTIVVVCLEYTVPVPHSSTWFIGQAISPLLATGYTSLAAGLSEPYVALYAYSPTRSDELAFAEHDQIQILTNPPFEVCEGWLYGELDGRYGLVPATYVRKISASEVAAGLNSTLPADPFALPTSTTAENPTGNPFPAFETPAQQPNSLPLSDDAPVESVEFDGEKPLFACLALYNFDAAHPGDLSLQINDKVDVFVDNSGWYEGVSRRTGQRGIFPANHVQKLQSDAEVPSTSAATQASAFTILATVADTTKTALPGSAPAPDTSSAVREDKSADEGTPARPTTDRVDGEEDEAEAVITVSDSPELAVAVTPFTAQSSEQLSLTVGQYVKILKRSSTGWWEGETQLRGQDRQIGWFPSDYVRLVGATTTTSAPNEPSPAHHVGDPSKNAQPPAATQGSGPPNSQGTVSPAGEPQQSSSASVVTADLSSASVVQSMFAYKASQPDELTFPEGALIEVLAHEEEGWWRGRIQSTGVEGLFPVNYVKPYAKPANAPASSPLATASNSRPCTHGGTGDDTAAKSSIPVAQDHRSTRQNILLEFVESERQYYRDLFEVKEKIYEGLKKQNVGEKKLSQIFCNWATLCDISEAFNKYAARLLGLLNKGLSLSLTHVVSFFRDFQERKRLIAKNPNELIGDILVRHLPKCMVYRDFCANQDVALSRLEKLCEENPDVASFLQSCQRLMRVRAMPLSSYFLKPMQRITKYKLLIEKLLKHTQPTHPDRANLEQSLELASTILDVCNEAIRNRENFVQLQWLQDHVAFASRDEEISFVGDELLSPFFGSRRLILSGTLFKVKSKKELTAFLFNDMLFLTQPINFSATTLPTGNFTLPLKPDASLKVFFRAYRKPLSTANIRVSETVLSRPRRRSAWIGGLSQASASDLSTVGVAETTTVGREPRAKRRTLANFRQLSLSMNNLSTVSADTAASPSTSFFITDDTDRAIFLHVRAPSEALKATWLEKIRKTSTDHQRLMNRFKDRGSLRSDTGKGSLFAAVLNLTVISATGLRLVGPNADEMPWPYCEVSVCLRSKKTNVILSTTSPKWNCPLRFTVKDLSRDVITLTVYSKNASAVEEFLGRVEVSMEAVARHCRSKPNGPWETKFPLVVGGDDDDDVQHDASLTDSQFLAKLNLGPEVDPESAAMFNIIFWLSLVLILAVWAVSYGMWNMDPGRDGILYRMTPGRPKTE
ncbi:unnamed protein product [Mesocestoides corti]|uniref:Dynamin-binding protein n=1 Tax=Mesocestoides corti TaxID=53468 RepID=A0A158QW82_MESCO|nr:unnamed protein product [Mesocestoides corti]